MLHKWHHTGWVICLVYVCYSNGGRFSRCFYDFSIVFCNWPDTVVFSLTLIVNKEFTFAFIIIHTFYWSEPTRRVSGHTYLWGNDLASVSTRRVSGHIYLWGNDLPSVSSIFRLDLGTVWICFFILLIWYVYLYLYRMWICYVLLYTCVSEVV